MLTIEVVRYSGVTIYRGYAIHAHHLQLFKCRISVVTTKMSSLNAVIWSWMELIGLRYTQMMHGYTLLMELKKIDTITTSTVLLNESFIGITLHIPTAIGIDYIKTNNSIY